MTDDKNSSTHEHQRRKATGDTGILGGIYGMAFIGAAVYYISHAATFWEGVLGFLKSLVLQEGAEREFGGQCFVNGFRVGRNIPGLVRFAHKPYDSLPFKALQDSMHICPRNPGLTIRQS
ncbi:MAG: hypothetical protein FJ217_08805 [Ignavibacteria bacterium]|nr:hypothetical protein [Ignavibacteria bacterium]